MICRPLAVFLYTQQILCDPAENYSVVWQGQGAVFPRVQIVADPAFRAEATGVINTVRILIMFYREIPGTLREP